MTGDLPANVRPVTDRHGKVRYRFRRRGWKSAYLPGEPGSAEFHAAYAKVLSEGEVAAGEVSSPRTINPRTLDDLYARVRKSADWRKKGERTRYVQNGVMSRFLDRVSKSGHRYGERPVASVTFAWLDGVLGDMWETPAAANVLRKILSTQLDYAMRLGWIAVNAARLVKPYQDGEGFHDWTDGEIEQYRGAHPLGTMARLTLELALNTAARRCNVALIERAHIQEGRIAIDHAKGNNATSVPMLPTTQAAIDAMPAAPIRYLVVTEFGKPFTVAGLGNRMRKWCDTAGLPHCSMHGLRKAMSRRLAESGATDAEGQAITGHKKAETFAYYRAKANRSALADRAMGRLHDAGDASNPTASNLKGRHSND